jgi:hypothetical protein
MAQVCGVLNAATGRLVALIAKALASGAWQQGGVCSPGHWVAWQCGLSSAHARSLVTMANRLGELPVTRAALRREASARTRHEWCAAMPRPAWTPRWRGSPSGPPSAS